MEEILNIAKNLLQIGFVARTPRGRQVLPPAYEHLGFEYQTKMNM